MSITRIYKVTETGNDGRVWLVDAPSQSGAVACVARSLFSTEIAKPKEIIGLMNAGVTILSAVEVDPAGE
jgi:hypothetical protein